MHHCRLWCCGQNLKINHVRICTSGDTFGIRVDSGGAEIKDEKIQTNRVMKIFGLNRDLPAAILEVFWATLPSEINDKYVLAMIYQIVALIYPSSFYLSHT